MGRHAVGRAALGAVAAAAVVGVVTPVAAQEDPSPRPWVEDRIVPAASDTNSVGTDVDLVGDLLVVGVPQARFGAGEVHVYRYRCGWQLEAVLADPDEPEPSSANLGRLVATDGESVAATQHTRLGARGFVELAEVFVVEPDERGELVRSATIELPSMPDDLALDNGRIAVTGSRDAISVHRRTATGSWAEETVETMTEPDLDRTPRGIDISGDVIATIARDGDLDVYRRDGETWSIDTRLEVPSLGHYGAELAEYARVAVDGDRIAVGNTIGFGGAVHLFERDGDTWAGPTTIQAPVPQLFDRFGLSVDLDGDRLVVGDGATANGGTDIGFPVAAPEEVTVHERVGPGRWELRDVILPTGARIGDDDSVAPTVALHGGRFAVGLPAIDGPARGGVVVYDDPAAPTSAPTDDAYWLATDDGHLCGFGPGANALPNRRVATGIQVVDAERVGAEVVVLGSDGRLVTVGADAGESSVPPLDGAPIAVVPDPDGDGAWVVSTSGDVAAMDAADLGSLAGLPLNAPIVDATGTPDGEGLLLLAADGGVFALGSASFRGSVPGALPPGATLAAPVVSMAADPDGEGYVVFAADGGAFAFDAEFHGSIPGVLPPGTALVAPIIGATTTDAGYLLVAADGGVFAFGDADFLGSLGSDPPAQPVVALVD